MEQTLFGHPGDPGIEGSDVRVPDEGAGANVTNDKPGATAFPHDGDSRLPLFKQPLNPKRGQRGAAHQILLPG